MHEINILVHVVTGTIALILGIVCLVTVKGGRLHILSGRCFLGLMVVVILTGLFGVFVFGRNAFLLVVTILSGYVAYSGYRVTKSKNNIPNKLDILIAMLSAATLFYFLYYFKSIGMIWAPVIIYSTVGALMLVIVYDMLRYLIPREAYKKHKIWIYEHIYKMTSGFAALFAAFTGTVLDAYQPHSQYLPSAIGLLIIFGFMGYTYRYGLKRTKS